MYNAWMVLDVQQTEEVHSILSLTLKLTEGMIYRFSNSSQQN